MIELFDPEEKDLHYQKIKYHPTFLMNGQIDLKNLIDKFQIIASRHIDKLQMGEEFEKENSFFYVVLRYKGYFLEKLKEEDYTLITYPVEATALTMYRYAYLLDKNGKCVFYLISLWVMMDRKTRRIKPCKTFSMKLKEKLEDIDSLLPLSEEKLSNFSVDDYQFTYKKDYIVKKEDIDGNGHMNNTVYFGIAQESLHENTISSFELDYERECFLGERLSIFADSRENETILIGKKGDELSFKVKFIS